MESGGDRRKPAKGIKAQTDVFLRYLKNTGSRGNLKNPQELEKMKPELRTQETIRSVGLVYRYAQEVLSAERQGIASVVRIERLSEFEKEARRLQWLSSHVN